MEPQTSAPPVVAVVVARDPGETFEEVLSALGAQDYPNQSVLVIDAGTRSDCGPRVASILPDAYLRRVRGPALDGSAGSGFAAAANDVLESVQGAAFLLFCHGDAAPDTDAVRHMVEEALRSNAGVVGPKLVEWDRPDRLLEVGLAVDKTGARESLVERGELDQEQHDPVRDVFAVSSVFMLVRSDLFSALGGFDPVMDNRAADVDLCWRAQVAGARVLVAPAARVRHREEGSEASHIEPDHGAVSAAHHLRAMLKSYSSLHLLRVVPQAAVVTLAEVLLALFRRRWAEARHFAAAWWWNLRHLRDLWPLRRTVQRARAVPDSEVRRLQVRGSVRLTVYLRRRLHAEDRAQALLSAGQRLVGSVGRGPARAATAVLILLAAAIVVGSRGLWGDRIAAAGQLTNFPQPLDLLRHYVDGWRTTGMGSNSSAPPAFFLLGLGGTVMLGKMALLRTAIVLGAWVAGAWGMWRLGRPWQSTLGRVVGVIAYLAVPLPYNSLAQGKLSGLIAYATAPWLMARVLRLWRSEPFAADGGSEWPPPAGFRLDVLKLAILLAVAAAFVPSIAVALIVASLGLAAGGFLTGDRPQSVRALMSVAIAVGLAAALLVPWSFEVVATGSWSTLVGVPTDGDRGFGLGALLRFETGPMGAPPLGWALLIVAILPLFVGRGWRLEWAARLWLAALACVIVAWAGGRGWLPLRLQSPEVLLAPAACALATSAAMGAVAFTVDLRRYRFGWRQAGSVAAGAVLALGTVPVLGAVPNGRWNATGNEAVRSLGWMEPLAADGAFRVLWLGDPTVLPLDGWHLGDGVAYATSRDGRPDYTDLLPGPPSAATRSIGRAVRLAAAGDTTRLGRLLAPMAVRYIVVPRQLSGGEPDPDAVSPPPRLERGLGAQLDLRLLPVDPALTVYENIAWGPARALLSGDHRPLPEDALGSGADLDGNQPVMTGGGPVRYRGEISRPGTVLFSETPASAWQLTVGGRPAPRSPAFAVANAFQVDRPGIAELRLRTPWLTYLAVAINLALWAAAFRFLIVLRRRQRLEEPSPG